MRILGNKTLEKDADRLALILLDGQALVSAKLLKATGGSGGTPGLDVDNGVTSAITNAKFGAHLPLYFVHNSPIIGFNLYFDGSNWKLGKGSSAHFGGRLSYDPSANRFTFRMADAAGSADTTVTETIYLNIGADLFTDAWTDYSATSTVAGWSSYTTKSIFYKKVGKTVFVNFAIVGTSNATNCTLTVPYTMVSTGPNVSIPIRAMNNGTYLTGLMELYTSGNTVTMYTSFGGALWTNSGNKAVYGQFWYQSST